MSPLVVLAFVLVIFIPFSKNSPILQDPNSRNLIVHNVLAKDETSLVPKVSRYKRDLFADVDATVPKTDQIIGAVSLDSVFQSNTNVATQSPELTNALSPSENDERIGTISGNISSPASTPSAELASAKASSLGVNTATASVKKRTRKRKRRRRRRKRPKNAPKLEVDGDSLSTVPSYVSQRTTASEDRDKEAELDGNYDDESFENEDVQEVPSTLAVDVGSSVAEVGETAGNTQSLRVTSTTPGVGSTEFIPFTDLPIVETSDLEYPTKAIEVRRVTLNMEEQPGDLEETTRLKDDSLVTTANAGNDESESTTLPDAEIELRTIFPPESDGQVEVKVDETTGTGSLVENPITVTSSPLSVTAVDNVSTDSLVKPTTPKPKPRKKRRRRRRRKKRPKIASCILTPPTTEPPNPTGGGDANTVVLDQTSRPPPEKMNETFTEETGQMEEYQNSNSYEDQSENLVQYDSSTLATPLPQSPETITESTEAPQNLEEVDTTVDQPSSLVIELSTPANGILVGEMHVTTDATLYPSPSEGNDETTISSTSPAKESSDSPPLAEDSASSEDLGLNDEIISFSISSIYKRNKDSKKPLVKNIDFVFDIFFEDDPDEEDDYSDEMSTTESLPSEDSGRSPEPSNEKVTVQPDDGNPQKGGVDEAEPRSRSKYHKLMKKKKGMKRIKHIHKYSESVYIEELSSETIEEKLIKVASQAGRATTNTKTGASIHTNEDVGTPPVTSSTLRLADQRNDETTTLSSILRLATTIKTDVPGSDGSSSEYSEEYYVDEPVSTTDSTPSGTATNGINAKPSEATVEPSTGTVMNEITSTSESTEVTKTDDKPNESSGENVENINIHSKYNVHTKKPKRKGKKTKTTKAIEQTRTTISNFGAESETPPSESGDSEYESSGSEYSEESSETTTISNEPSTPSRTTINRFETEPTGTTTGTTESRNSDVALTTDGIVVSESDIKTSEPPEEDVSDLNVRFKYNVHTKKPKGKNKKKKPSKAIDQTRTTSSVFGAESETPPSENGDSEYESSGSEYSEESSETTTISNEPNTPSGTTINRFETEPTERTTGSTTESRNSDVALTTDGIVVSESDIKTSEPPEEDVSDINVRSKYNVHTKKPKGKNKKKKPSKAIDQTRTTSGDFGANESETPPSENGDSEYESSGSEYSEESSETTTISNERSTPSGTTINRFETEPTERTTIESTNSDVAFTTNGIVVSESDIKTGEPPEEDVSDINVRFKYNVHTKKPKDKNKKKKPSKAIDQTRTTSSDFGANESETPPSENGDSEYESSGSEYSEESSESTTISNMPNTPSGTTINRFEMETTGKTTMESRNSEVAFTTDGMVVSESDIKTTEPPEGDVSDINVRFKYNVHTKKPKDKNKKKKPSKAIDQTRTTSSDFGANESETPPSENGDSEYESSGSEYSEESTESTTIGNMRNTLSETTVKSTTESSNSDERGVSEPNRKSGESSEEHQADINVRYKYNVHTNDKKRKTPVKHKKHKKKDRKEKIQVKTESPEEMLIGTAFGFNETSTGTLKPSIVEEHTEAPKVKPVRNDTNESGSSDESSDNLSEDYSSEYYDDSEDISLRSTHDKDKTRQKTGNTDELSTTKTPDVTVQLKSDEEQLRELTKQPGKEAPTEQIDEKPNREPDEQEDETLRKEPEEQPDEALLNEPEKQPNEALLKEPEEQPDDALFKEPEEQPDEALLIEPEEKPDEALFKEPEEQADEALLTEPDEQPDEVLFKEPEEQPDEALLKEPEEQPDDALFKEPEEQPDEALLIEPEEKPDEALFKEPEEQADEALLTQPEEQPDEALFKEPEEQPDEALFKEPEEQPDEALFKEPEEQPDESLFKEPEDQPDEALLIEPEAKPDEAFFKEPEEQADEALLTEPDERPDEALFKEPEEQADEALPMEPDEQPDEALPKEHEEQPGEEPDEQLNEDPNEETDVDVDEERNKESDEVPDEEQGENLNEETEDEPEEDPDDEPDEQPDEDPNEEGNDEPQEEVVEEDDSSSSSDDDDLNLNDLIKAANDLTVGIQNLGIFDKGFGEGRSTDRGQNLEMEIGKVGTPQTPPKKRPPSSIDLLGYSNLDIEFEDNPVRPDDVYGKMRVVLA